jgi:hypothetical protein
LRIVLKLICSVPLLVVLAMLQHTYKRSILFRKPVAHRLDPLRRRSLWVFNFNNYEVAGYDVVARMRTLLFALFIGWAILFVGLVAL